MAWAKPYVYIANHSTYGKVHVFDFTYNGATTGATITPVATVDVPGYIWGLAVSQDGSRVYAGEQSRGGLAVIDTATNTVTATVPGIPDPIGVAVSPDGSRVYVTSPNYNSVSVVDTATNKVTTTLTGFNYPWGLAVSPDGNRVYVTNQGSSTVSVIDTALNTTPHVMTNVTVGSTPSGLAVLPNGSRVYVANEGGTVSVIDTTSNTVMATADLTGLKPRNVAVDPDGSRVFVSSYTYKGWYAIIPTATNQWHGGNSANAYPDGIALTPDGEFVFTANNSGASGGGEVQESWVGYAQTATVPVATPHCMGKFMGPGALIAINSNLSGGAGSQISASVPTLTNHTSPVCTTTDNVVEQPTKGTLSLDSATGAYTYTPSSKTYSGPDAFTWRGEAPSSCTQASAPLYPVSNTATVSITINPLLTGLGDVSLDPGQSTTQAFSLTGSAPFKIKLASDNTTVLPDSGLTISPSNCGTAGNLSCTLKMATANTTGKTHVTVTATDKYGDTVKKTLLVGVGVSITSGGGSTSSGSNTGGGGALSPWTLLLLLGMRFAWRRRKA